MEAARESDKTYTFIMPAGDVTVSAVFRLNGAEKNPSSQVVHCEAGGFPSAFQLGFGDDAADWLSAIDSVTVNGTPFRQGAIGFGSSGALWNVGGYTGAYETYTALQIMKDAVDAYPAEIVVSAAGYRDLVISLSKTTSGYREIYVAEIKSSPQEPEPPEVEAISLEQISISSDMFGHDWYFAFQNAENYVSSITSLSVNGEVWEKKDFKPSAGGAYYPDFSENRLTLCKVSFGNTETLKSGDIVTITAEGYQDLTFQFVVAPDGTASVQTPDSQGDPYQLHLKLAGSFEAAIVGQKDYDGVSGATGSASANKNSQVTVYGALLEKDREPEDEDWKELENWSSGIDIDGSKTYVSIVPDTEKGTPADSDSGMKGVYFTISSSLTLSGTPKDPGAYLIFITAADNQGRTATSNALPFRIYTGEETLAEQLRTENLTQTQDGKYMWDIMEPWAIKNFGSNVEGAENRVRIPAPVKAWYGSHESGTYGYLGYDIPWTDVEKGSIPQTLSIPDGCDLTLVNMEILSSVRIVVEGGGKLTLQDSVVQGIVDVQSGGVFSMNYNGFGENPGFLTGASLCGQLRLEDGAVLENAAIYSHTNYLANGDLVDRTSKEPVVTAAGNVTVRGQVFIQGDEAGDNCIGQAGLRVQNGTLTLEDGAVLAVYGGGAKVQLYPTGGTAIQLENGAITGNGKVAAIAGQAFWGDGGTAVAGTGSISADEAFLQGGTAWASNNAAPGTAVAGTISVTSPNRHIADGTQVETLEDDPLEELYWKTGIDAVPPLDRFTTQAWTEDGSYVLMNIPYAAFYKAVGTADSSTDYDAISSATNKVGNYGKSGGAFHSGVTASAEGETVAAVGGANGAKNEGVIWPVKVGEGIVLSDLEAVEVASDATKIVATVGRGQTSASYLYGYECLMEAPAYSYYVLDSEPSYYLELTSVSGGAPVFSSAPGRTAETKTGASVTASYGTNWGDVQLKVDGARDVSGKLVNAVVITAVDGSETTVKAGLVHLYNIWSDVDLAWRAATVHGLDGKSIQSITYYCSDKDDTVAEGNSDAPAYKNYIYQYSVRGLEIPSVYTGTVSASFNGAGEIVLTGLPEGMQDPKAKVYHSEGSGHHATLSYLTPLAVDSADQDIDPVSVDITGGKITISSTLQTVTNDNGESKTYGQPVDGTEYTFEISSSNWIINKVIAVYQAGSAGSGGNTGGGSTGGGTASGGSTSGGSTGGGSRNSGSSRSGGTARPPVVEVTDPETPLAGLPGGFTDVKTGAYYYDAVQWAVANGITSGTSAATFSPDAVCTRAQAVTFLWRASGSPAPQSSENPFTDVPLGAYYYDAVLWAVEKKITLGTSSTTFSPDATVTRSQVVTFLHRLSGSPAAEGTNAFTDVASDAFYAGAVQWAVDKGITSGTSPETFSPNSGCTRAQILTFLFRSQADKA